MSDIQLIGDMLYDEIFLPYDGGPVAEPAEGSAWIAARVINDRAGGAAESGSSVTGNPRYG
jgi:hypothetical protein